MKSTKNKKRASLPINYLLFIVIMVVGLFLAFPAIAKIPDALKSGIGSTSEKACGIESSITGNEDCDEEVELSLFSNPNSNQLSETNRASNEDAQRIVNEHISISEFASNEGIEREVLNAIITVETRAKSLDSEGHPIVRFECHRFNPVVSSSNLPCTIESGDTFSRVASETNKEAFLKAKEINEEQAIMQSSFGFPQIMGFNYRAAGYSSPKDFYEAMFKEENQVSAFLNFLGSNSDLMTALKNKDWDEIARLYNGAKYEENNYHVKLENAYDSQFT